MLNQSESINPKNIESKDKETIIRQNIYHSKNGDYKQCPEPQIVKFPYIVNSYIEPINSICKVTVQHKHALDVANVFSEHGLVNMKNVNPPVIVYPVGINFDGSNYETSENIFEEQIILKTNYLHAIRNQYDIFNSKDKQKYVVYTNPITVIRDEEYNPLTYDTIFKVGIITVCYQNVNKLLNDMMFSNDLLTFQIYMDTIFQTAICGKHEILLLPIFSNEHNIPIHDQIKIYNVCIMKYSHKFKIIIICVPQYENDDLYELLDNEIIKPQILTKTVDIEYTAKKMAKLITKP
jgi:hypothetical protein